MASAACQSNCRRCAYPLEQDCCSAALSLRGRVLRTAAHARSVHATEVQARHFDREDLNRRRHVAQPARLHGKGLALAIVPDAAVDGPGMRDALQLEKVRQLMNQN